MSKAAFRHKAKALQALGALQRALSWPGRLRFGARGAGGTESRFWLLQSPLRLGARGERFFHAFQHERLFAAPWRAGGAGLFGKAPSGRPWRRRGGLMRRIAWAVIGGLAQGAEGGFR